MHRTKVPWGLQGGRGARRVRADGLGRRLKRRDNGQVCPEIRAHELAVGQGWEVIILGDGGR